MAVSVPLVWLSLMVTQNEGTGAELEVVGLLGHVEAQVVGQKAHLHPSLAAVVLVTGAVYVAVDVEGVDVAIGGEGGFVFVVQHDFGKATGSGPGRRETQATDAGGVSYCYAWCAPQRGHDVGGDYRAARPRPTLPWRQFQGVWTGSGGSANSV